MLQAKMKLHWSKSGKPFATGSRFTVLPAATIQYWHYTVGKTSKQMAAQVPDEVLEEFAVIATYDNLVSKLTERFGGQTDSMTLPMPEGIPETEARELIQDIRHIDSPFRLFAKTW